jgi:tetratricopeptide (TPR) repeat protein
MAEALTTSTSEVGDDVSTSPVLARHPQPLGLFPLPLGYMLIPASQDDEATESARQTMLDGRLPERWPASLRAHELAAAGNRDAAIAALESQADPVARYNRFVLDSRSIDADDLRSTLGEFAVLVDVVLFTLGRADTPPLCDGSDGEIAAAVLSAQASHALADGNVEAATELLDRAADAAECVSKSLTGLLMGAAGALARDQGNPDCVARLQKALATLDGADGLRMARAEIHMCLAGVLHEQAQQRPELLATAIPHYHSTLQLIKRDDAPMLWAGAHARLATAYLTMPMVEASGQLRLGVAAQSLRSALTVYTRDEYPAEWASVQLNLANSLVYTPSRHQRENLVEAVEIYEALLQMRDRATDPLGRARVLTNQGNVLAHLGVFEDAKAKLYEARFLFEELGDNDSVRTVRGVLDEIARQRVLSTTDDAGRQ